MRLRRLVLIVLSAGACAGPRAPTPADALASSLARAALAEWEGWGRIVVVGWPEERPADTAATPARFTRLLEYWSAVPGGDRVVHRLLGLRSGIAALAERSTANTPGDDGAAGTGSDAASRPEDISLYEYPAWSAAFISAMARRAGVPESDLPSSSRHARYIDAVLARAIADPERASFRAHAPEGQAPTPGDLLCADRAAVPLTHWSMRLAELGRPRPMHCDVVVRTAPGVIEAVGGNVQGLVVLRRLPSDGMGRVLPAPSGQPPFVLVLTTRSNAEAVQVATVQRE